MSANSSLILMFSSFLPSAYSTSPVQFTGILPVILQQMPLPFNPQNGEAGGGVLICSKIDGVIEITG
jgi:hypothetical protein